MNIIKNIYRQREEISIKLIEYINQLEKHEINKFIYDQLLGFYEFLNERQIEIDKLETQLFKFYKIQLYQFLQEISNQYETLVFSKSSENNYLLKKYQERISYQKCLKDTKQIVLVQKKYFYQLLKFFHEYLRTRSKNFGEQKHSLEIFPNFKNFNNILEIDKQLTVSNILFLLNVQQKVSNHQELIDFEDLLNIEKQAQFLTPIVNYFDVYLNMYKQKNVLISKSLRNFKYSYEKFYNKTKKINYYGQFQNNTKEKSLQNQNIINNFFQKSIQQKHIILEQAQAYNQKNKQKKDEFQNQKVSVLFSLSQTQNNQNQKSRTQKSISYLKQYKTQKNRKSHSILPKHEQINQVDNSKQIDISFQSPQKDQSQKESQQIFLQTFHKKIPCSSNLNQPFIRVNNIIIQDNYLQSKQKNQNGYIHGSRKIQIKNRYQNQIPKQLENNFASQFFPIRSANFVRLKPKK